MTGVHTIEVKLTDDNGYNDDGGILTALQTLTLTLAGANDAPSFSSTVPSSEKSVVVGDSITVNWPGYSDPDATDSLVESFTIDGSGTLPSHVTWTAGSGSAIVAPTLNSESGVFTFSFIVTDDNTGLAASTLQAAETFLFTIIKFNSAPVFDSAAVDQDLVVREALVYYLPTVSDIDSATDTHTFSFTLLNGDPLPGFITYPGGTSREIRFDPGSNSYAGTYRILATVTDDNSIGGDQAKTDTTSFRLKVFGFCDVVNIEDTEMYLNETVALTAE